jgi:hypothetical protein
MLQKSKIEHREKSRESRSRGFSAAERQPCLPFVPIDHIKHHTALEHFGFQVSRVFLPFGRFSHAEAGFLILMLKGIICRRTATHGFVIIATLSLANAP